MSARLKPLTPERSAVHRFGALLRRLRIEAGFSQPELSAKLYTSKSTLSRAETGVRLLPRDLAEACDELLGAGGTLLTAWLHADSAPSIDSPGERPRRGSAALTFIPCLCTLALQCSAVGGLDPSFPAATTARRTEGFPAAACTAEGQRDRGRPLGLGRADRGVYSRSLQGDAHQEPPSARSSPRVAIRSRSRARGPARQAAGGALLHSRYPLGRSPFAVAPVAVGCV
ncbi:helix-turn-helix domain-containing protein [Actinospica sp. MGRD01-02]|uniref:Helix-turn-helix domain-containing protein n=1 Tax=Actinospica acidithermotolerans TaxID=2828514 RepID=A0A941EC90_9ACTN|nr:helix-turn-helix transcriptional regulator [Actinospica acidithermotolerans]MBR7827812.1 helix-turn-helix domain-containing protein [Actinospica acidithermotolerans]